MTAAKKILDEKFVRSLVPLGEMDPERFNQLSAFYSVVDYPAGSVVFAAESIDGRSYWLVAGQLSLKYSGGNARTITANTTQARYALAPEQPRIATAIAKTRVTILSMDSSLLDEFIHWNDRDSYKVSEIEVEDDGDWMTRFLQSKVFLKLPAQNIQALMMRLEEVHTQAGQTIIRQGDDDGYYYILKRGSCSVTRKHAPQAEEMELAVLTVGAGFGEEAIITHNRRGASVTMLEDGCLMRLSRNDFNRLLVEPLLQVVNYSEVANDTKNMFLDVRPYDEYINNGIKGSENIILTQIRPSINELDKEKIYTVCSNTGSRAAAAAFLLCQQGIEAVVLRYGLENLPTNVERGNQELVDGDQIPIVDNVVSLTAVDTKPSEAKEILETPKQFSPEEVMQDPTIRALFTKAKNRVGREAQKAAKAETAKGFAEKEVERLRIEAEQARKEVEEAKKQAQIAAHESAQLAREEANRESSRLRQIELGAKQAEMDEAVRQAEEEASRAQEANIALEQSKAEIARLKEEMHRAIEQTQSEARKSQLAVQQLADQQAKKQQIAAKRIEEEQTRKFEEIAQSKLLAEQESLQLKAATDQIREKYEEELKTQSDKIKSESENKIKRLQSEALLKNQEEKVQAAQEAVLQAKRASIAENARFKAEAEIVNLKKHTEEQQKILKQDSEKQLEQARADALKEVNHINVEQQAQIEAVLRDTQQLAKCVKQAEEAQVFSEKELERVRADTEVARKKMQEQLSSDIARSEIEHEVARARALELANKQGEIDEIARKAKEEANRAQRAEQARFELEQEIKRLKEDIERVRNEELTKNQNEYETTSEQFDLELEKARDEEVAKIREEIEVITDKAVEEASRAQAADDERRRSQEEIQRLKAEIELATRQAQAQLKADAEYAEAEQKELERREQEIEKLQTQVEKAGKNAELECERAKQAEQALDKAEQEVGRLKNTEQANVVAQQELEELRARQTVRKELEIENSKLKAEEESKRAKEAQRDKLQADKEIRRLNKVAKIQRKKAELVIQKTIKTARIEIDQNLVKMRAAKKAEQSIGKNIKKRESDKPLVVTNNKPDRKEPQNITLEKNSQWISDQVLWETTLGIRNDKVARKIIEQESSTGGADTHRSNVNTVAENTGKNSPHATYTARDVSPYINTQDVSEIVEKIKRGGIEKYILVILGVFVLGFGAYYATMGKSKRSDLQQTVSQDKTIKSIRNKVNEKLDTLSIGELPMIKNESKTMTMEQRIQKKKTKTDRIRLKQKNIGNEYRTTNQKSRTSKQANKSAKKAVKKAVKKASINSSVKPVKSTPTVNFNSQQKTVREQQSIESMVNKNATKNGSLTTVEDDSNLFVSVLQDAPQALQAGIPGIKDMVEQGSSLPKITHGPKVLQEAAAAVVPSSVIVSPDLNESLLPVIAEPTRQVATDIEIGDNLVITVDQPALPKALQE